MSVCEVGATIGRLWREMSDVNKQHFNDDFALDKVIDTCITGGAVAPALC